MIFNLRKKARPWKVVYTFVDRLTTVSIYEHFLTKAQAEQHFTVKRRYHARLLQPIIQAHLTGPQGFQQDLLADKVTVR